MNTNTNTAIDPAGIEKKVRIHLEVNAESLFNKAQLDLDDLEMWDNLGNYATGDETKDFSTEVTAGKKVEWKANVDDESEEKGYSIRLEQIEIIGENCLFNRVRIPGKSGKVKATVGHFTEECNSTYAIWFSILNKDGESVVFRLDPRLKGSTTAITYNLILEHTINIFPIEETLKNALLQVLIDFKK